MVEKESKETLTFFPLSIERERQRVLGEQEVGGRGKVICKIKTAAAAAALSC